MNAAGLFLAPVVGWLRGWRIVLSKLRLGRQRAPCVPFHLFDAPKISTREEHTQ